MIYGDWYMLYDGWYMLYDDLIYALCWLIHAIWCFDIRLMCFDICYMMISVWLIYVWYMIWHMFWYIYFDDVVICTPMYVCKYRNELCYKAPLCGMLSCHYDVEDLHLGNLKGCMQGIWKVACKEMEKWHVFSYDVTSGISAIFLT